MYKTFNQSLLRRYFVKPAFRPRFFRFFRHDASLAIPEQQEALSKKLYQKFDLETSMNNVRIFNKIQYIFYFFSLNIYFRFLKMIMMTVKKLKLSLSRNLNLSDGLS